MTRSIATSRVTATSRVQATSRSTVSGRNPTDISSHANIKFWLQAERLGLSNGGSVSQWTDTVGSVVLKQSTVANQPTYQTGVINSLPVVRFDGTNDILTTLGYPSIIPSNGQISVVVVAKTGTGGANHRFCGWTSNGWTAGVQGTIQSYFTTIGVKDYNTGTNDWNPQASFHVATYIFNSNFSVDFYMDGTLLSNKTGTTNATASTSTFNVGGRAAEFWNGDIAELLVFNTAISTTDRHLVERYLGTKYNLTVA